MSCGRFKQATKLKEIPITYAPQQQHVQTPGPVPLWDPLYGASLPEAMSRFFKKYSTFSGRASRSEYWWWALVSVIVVTVLEVILLVGGSAGAKLGPNGTSVPGPGLTIGLILLVVWFVAVIVPSLAVSVRRLHDANFSGWILLIGLIPFAGGIALLVLTLMPSNPAGQRFDGPGRMPVFHAGV